MNTLNVRKESHEVSIFFQNLQAHGIIRCGLFHCPLVLLLFGAGADGLGHIDQRCLC